MCVKQCQEPFAQCKVDAGEYCDGQDFGQGDDEPPPPERVYYNDGCYVEWSRTWWGKRKWEWVCPGDEGYVPDPDAEQPCSDE